MFSKSVSAGLVLLLCLGGEPVLSFAQQDSTAQAPAGTTNDQQQGVNREQPEDKASQQLINGKPETGVQLPPSPDAVQDLAAQQAAPSQPPMVEPPSGTAAAQEGKLAGNMASRPAGVAVAPDKQHEVRSLLIKTGIVAAAGVAIGTVYGLSRGTGSTPPGAK
jgi:hypothetical protein